MEPKPVVVKEKSLEIVEIKEENKEEKP